MEALALAVPTDSATGPLPADLVTLEAGAGSALDAAESQDWKTASSVVHRMSAAWDAYRTGGVPKLIEPRITDALRSLAGAADARDPARARQAAIDAAQSSLDLQLRYRPAAEVDLARLDLWISQLLLDAANHDAGAVNGDVFTLDYIRDRILALSRRSEATRINTQLGELQIAVVDADLDAATEAARRLRTSVAGIRAAA